MAFYIGFVNFEEKNYTLLFCHQIYWILLAPAGGYVSGCVHLSVVYLPVSGWDKSKSIVLTFLRFLC